ncbi:MAG TPA: branched-chain amino acid ABC transporter substrate-binding protein [Solirubrobacteraceae bacterium]|nr:branched-chain amino acid ABC transporter substrate-binding protein [Solirubrobacteraceae bacterium]
MIRRLGIVAVLAVAGCGGDDGGDRAARAPAAPPPDALAHCSSVIYEGDGKPDVLIASDFPLQGTYANDGLQATTAVRVVLRERGFKAGGKRVGYVSCDGATPRDDISEAKCRRAGRSYVAARDVVGVIGPFFSACAMHMMATLNRARLAEVGASNTYVGLTRAGPAIPEDQPERFRPTGKVTFVRLAAPDDEQGRAHVVLAGERGERSAYVLYDGVDAYGLGAAAAFRDAARDAGMDVVGFERWDPEASGYSALARRVRRSGADGVFLGGYIVSNMDKVIRALRAELGDDVTLMATEGAFPITVLRARAGEAAEGMFVTLSQVPYERLEGAGADFLAAFRQEINQNPCCYAIHVGQATHVLLDAIAASDGSRRAVTDAVVRTRVRDGIIGDFAFDANGDVIPPRVSVYRVTNGQQKLFDVVENP